MRILVSELIGQYAFGGVTWDYIQYAPGFRALDTMSATLSTRPSVAIMR
jgi:hypothetical protein